MRIFIGLFFVVCAILGILQLVNRGDDNYDPNWNSDCQYGDSYLTVDGKVIYHSDCK